MISSFVLFACFDNHFSTDKLTEGQTNRQME